MAATLRINTGLFTTLTTPNVPAKQRSKTAVVAGACMLLAAIAFGTMGILHAKHVATLPNALLKIGNLKVASVVLGIGSSAGLGLMIFGFHNRPSPKPPLQQPEASTEPSSPAWSGSAATEDEEKKRLAALASKHLHPNEYVVTSRRVYANDNEVLINYFTKDQENRLICGVYKEGRERDITPKKVTRAALEARAKEPAV